MTILVLGIYPRKMKIYVHKKTCKNVHSSFIQNSQKLELSQCSSIQEKDKQILVYSHSGILLSNKKEHTIDTYKEDGP